MSNLLFAQAELHEKQMEYFAATKDIHRHMLGQMAALEREKKEQAVMDKKLLRQRMIQDQKVCVHARRGLCVMIMGRG
jgi:mannose/fructose/N-acetylgalactosamine-specific phosphotransferase system component IID